MCVLRLAAVTELRDFCVHMQTPNPVLATKQQQQLLEVVLPVGTAACRF